MRSRDFSRGEDYLYDKLPVPLHELRDVADLTRLIALEGDADTAGLLGIEAENEVYGWWGKIVAARPEIAPNAYDWSEVATEDGLAYADLQDAQAGVAAEISGNRYVPIGVVVWVEGAEGDGAIYQRFSWPGLQHAGLAEVPTWTEDMPDWVPPPGNHFLISTNQPNLHLSGIVPETEPVPGQQITLTNIGTYPIPLVHLGDDAATPYRIATPGSTPSLSITQYLGPRESLTLYYDPTADYNRGAWTFHSSALNQAAAPARPVAAVPPWRFNQVAWIPPAGFSQFGVSATAENVALQGIAPTEGRVEGQEFVLVNDGDEPIRLEHLAVAAADGARLDLPDDTDIWLNAGDSITLVYSSAADGGNGAYVTTSLGLVSLPLELNQDTTVDVPAGQTLAFTGGGTVDLSGVLVDLSGTTLDLTGTTVTGLDGGTSEGTLVATGSTQGDAAAITTTSVVVTGADGTNGVILPSSPAGAIITVANDDTPDTLLVYPPSGARIRNLAINAASGVTNKQAATFIRVSSTQWVVIAAGGIA